MTCFDQWATVCLRQPHGVLLKALHSILADMHRIRMDLPGLSVISSLVDQVSLFSVNSELDTPGVIDKGLMHNECVRRSTFKDWPHLDYKFVYRCILSMQNCLDLKTRARNMLSCQL